MATAIPAIPCIPNIPRRQTYSCIRCAERKVKCDRKTPCTACTRHNVDCVFNPSQPPRNRHKRPSTQTLIDQLRQYEALLRAHGVDVNKPQHVPNSEIYHHPNHTITVVQNEPQLCISRSIEAEPGTSISKAQVIQDSGRSKFVNNVLWARMVEELHNPQDALGDSSDESSDSEASSDYFVFSTGSQLRGKTKSSHPPGEGILQLWQIFTENVDPLTKVLHTPTLRLEIEKAASDIGNIPRGFEALLFAIYNAAVMSLSDEDCEHKLYEPRKVLLSRYIHATKVALSRARFMKTTSLVVLQALVIYLIAVRDIDEPRAIWSLTGVAVRIAQGMGLERDGEYLSLPPFETEMRRRIWWQLKIHDFRTAELCGIGKFQDLHTGSDCTKWPTNINDDELYPGMTSLAAEPNKLADDVSISLKCELLNYAASQVAVPHQKGNAPVPCDVHTSGSSAANMDESAIEINDLLETKYLRYCDPSQPLHLMVMLMARCSINIIRFMSHHPRKWAGREHTPLSERQWVLDTCLKLLERQSMLQSNPLLKRFAWHAPYFQHWHAVIHILDTLRTDPPNANADKAWDHISNVYENNPDLILDIRKPIHGAVNNLCLKAYDIRETAMRSGDTQLSPLPYFIVQLRQQREALTARRPEQSAKGGQPSDPVSQSQGTSPKKTTRWQQRSGNDAENISGRLVNSYLKQRSMLLRPHIPTPGSTSFSSERHSVQVSHDGGNDRDNLIDNGIMRSDFITEQLYNIEYNDVYSVTWDQWDALLADSNY